MSQLNVNRWDRDHHWTNIRLGRSSCFRLFLLFLIFFLLSSGHCSSSLWSELLGTHHVILVCIHDQTVIQQRSSNHRFHDRHSAWQHTLFMSSKGLDHRFLTRLINSVLCAWERADRFERSTHNDIFTGGDTTQNATMVVGACGDLAILNVVLVVVLRTLHGSTLEATAILDTLYSVDTHQSGCEFGLDFPRLWRTDTRRTVLNDALNYTTHTIHFLFHAQNQFLHRFSSLGIGSTYFILLDERSIERLCDHSSNLFHMTNYIDAVHHVKDLLGNGTGSHTSNSDSSRAAPSTTVVSETIATVIGVVGVHGTILFHDVGVISTAYVVVEDHDHDRCTSCQPVEESTVDYTTIEFVPWCGHTALAWATSIQLDLNVLTAERDAGRTTVHNHAYSRAMALTKRSESKQMAE
mmetsp:Transcript_11996/g.36467  ORF Transcript_11996/g.36467 Transcript_11996/m.36467 type:complete len:409 (-) Transcript_11996:61-1287(-)